MRLLLFKPKDIPHREPSGKCLEWIDGKYKEVRNAKGSPVSQSYYYWHAESVELNEKSIIGFSRVAMCIQNDMPAYRIARGELTKAGMNRQYIRRLLYDDGQDKATIQDCASQLLFLDVEYRSPKFQGLYTEIEKIEAYIKLLPKQFHEVTYHYQLSAKHGADPTELRAHLFFWMSKALTCEQLQYWLESKVFDDPHGESRGTKTFREMSNRLVDSQPIQPHTAIIMSAPVFKTSQRRNLNNYLTSPRSGLVEHKNLEVVPPPAASKFRPKPKPRKIELTDNEMNDCSWSLEEAQNMLLKQAKILNATTEGRSKQAYVAGLILGGVIEKQRLKQHEVEQLLFNACVNNGVVKKKGRRDVLRSIRKGIEKGRLDPKGWVNKSESYARSRRKVSQSQTPSKAETNQAKTRISQVDAVQITPPPTQPAEVISGTQLLIEKIIRDAEQGAITVGQSMAGAGKTHALIDEAIKHFNDNNSVFYATRNHELATEPNGILDRLNSHENLSVEPVHWEGKERRCAEIQELKADSSREAQDRLEDYKLFLDESPIPRFCIDIGCTRHGTDQCNTWREEVRPIEDQLIVAPQAYLTTLKKREDAGTLPENLLIIIDELSQLLHTTAYKQDLIGAVAFRDTDQVYADHQKAGIDVAQDFSIDYRATHQPISKFAVKLSDALNALKTEHIKKLSKQNDQGHYGYRCELTPADFKDLFEDAQSVLNYFEQVNPKVKSLSLKKLEQSQNKEKLSGERVKRSGIRIIQDLALLITGQLPDTQMLHLSLSRSSKGADDIELFIERRTLQELPRTARIVVADATPRPLALNLYAQLLGFKVKYHHSDIQPHRVNALHVKSKSYQTSALIASNGGIKNRGVTSLNGLYHPFLLHLRKLRDGERVGVMCSHKMYNHINDALKGKGQLAESGFILSIKRFNVTVGYVGRDHQGSSKFEDCKALIMLGEAKANVSAVTADFDLLHRGQDYDPRLLYKELTDGITDQIYGRLRSVWHDERIFICVTPERPEHLKNAKWTTYTATGNAVSKDNADIELKAIQSLDRGESITRKTLETLGASYTASERIINRIDNYRSLTVYKLKTSKCGQPADAWCDSKVKSKEQNANAFEDSITDISTSKKSNSLHMLEYYPELHKRYFKEVEDRIYPEYLDNDSTSQTGPPYI